MKSPLNRKKNKVKLTIFIFLVSIGVLAYFVKSGSALSGTVYPDGDVTEGWASVTGCTATTHYQCIDETGGNSTADYVNTGTSGTGGEVEEYTMTSVAGSSNPVTQVDVTIFANSVACSGGGTNCDTLDVNIRINSTLQTAQTCTMTATNTSCTKTFTGSWTGDADLQVQITRNVVGTGPTGSRDDDVQLTSVNASVTYTSNSAPGAPTQATPSSGSTVNSTTPNLVMHAADPDGDAVKYKLFVYNTTANSGGNCTGTQISGSPFDQTASGTGWDNGTTAYTSGANATYTIQSALTRGNGYCWQSQAIDPGGTNTFGSLATASTFTINSVPNAPTLATPSSGATNVSITPSFTLSTTDADNDYVQFRIYLYQSDCSTVVGSSPFDMSGAGWSGQDANGGTAYGTTGPTTATYAYQGTLSNSTTYCWKADAIDPGGSNTYGSASSTRSFTTAAPAGGNTAVQGGVIIQGGSIVH